MKFINARNYTVEELVKQKRTTIATRGSKRTVSFVYIDADQTFDIEHRENGRLRGRSVGVPREDIMKHLNVVMDIYECDGISLVVLL